MSDQNDGNKDADKAMPEPIDHPWNPELADSGGHFAVFLLAMALMFGFIFWWLHHIASQRPAESDIKKTALGEVKNVIGLGGRFPSAFIEMEAGYFRVDKPRGIPKGTPLVLEQWPNGSSFICQSEGHWCLKVQPEDVQLLEPTAKQQGKP